MSRDPANYSGTDRGTIKTYGARFIQRNAAFDALIELTGFKNTEYLKWNSILDSLVLEKIFEAKISSQIEIYGKKDTLNVINFLISALNAKNTQESLLNINFTEEQKRFLLSVNEVNGKYAERINSARNKLGNAYRKCHPNYI